MMKSLHDLQREREPLAIARAQAKVSGLLPPDYSDRPLACRTHFNLDDDALLCEVDPEYTADVPYANAVQIRVTCYATAADGERFADIRDFFPSPPD